MRTSNAAICAAVALAAAALSGCGNPASTSTFEPPASTSQSTAAAASGVGAWRHIARYHPILLDSLGGSVSFAINIQDSGEASGTSLLIGNSALHAQAWVHPPKTIDLGTLGGTNSAIFQYNHGRAGNFVGWSETSNADPYAENYCGFGTTAICRGFYWRHGKMTALPSLGGNNDQANDINWRGQIAGDSETTTQDASCNPPQVFDFLAVIWQSNGTITTLPPYPGDTVSYAYTLDQLGRNAVGNSGPCAASTEHAVLWHDASSPIDLGSLGGSVNIALDINDWGQVIGNSSLYGNATTHAFLWQNGTMSDLGTLPGDVDSFAGGINDWGQIVGQSCNASGACRGFYWQKGSMYDLNTLVPPGKGLNIPFASNINDRGEISAATVNTQSIEQALLLIPHGWTSVAPHRGSVPVFTPRLVNARQSMHARYWDLRSRFQP